METPTKAQPAKQAKRPAQPDNLGFVPAKELIDKTILILGVSKWGDIYARRMVSARFADGRSFYFPAGVVVEQQLSDPGLAFPVWAKLTWNQGQYGFYALALADTVGLQKISEQKRKNAKPKCKTKPKNT